MISPGELCEVRDIGMRTTKLYDVEGHTEIYYPNKQLVDEKITNVSRPDPELRVSTSIHLPISKTNLEDAERVLMDIAYGDDEVEQSLVDKSELDEFGPDSDIRRQVEDKVRVILEDEVGELERNFPEIKGTEVKQMTNMTIQADKFEDIASNALRNIKLAKQKYLDGEEKNDQAKRYEAIEQRVNEFHRLSNAMFALSDQHPDLREQFEPLLAELSREPLVHSEFEIGNVKLTLYVFVLHLERRMQVEERLNSQILKRLRGTR